MWQTKSLPYGGGLKVHPTVERVFNLVVWQTKSLPYGGGLKVHPTVERVFKLLVWQTKSLPYSRAGFQPVDTAD